MIKLVLCGRPYTKKNTQTIDTRGSRPIVLPSKNFERYQNDCLKQITGAHRKNVDFNVLVEVAYYMRDRSGWPDLVGLMQATADILEKAGVLKNDKFISSWGRTRIAGLDKQNPRAEIFIMPDPYELHISMKGSGK